MRDVAADPELARLEYGKAITLAIPGAPLLVFRPATKTEAEDFRRKRKLEPSAVTELAISFALACALDQRAAEEIADQYPLAFEGLAKRLFEQVTADARAVSREAISGWRNSGRNLGQMAEALLAFKAYSGGEYDAKTFQGALHVADWLDSTKGVFLLFLNLMKGLARR